MGVRRLAAGSRRAKVGRKWQCAAPSTWDTATASDGISSSASWRLLAVAIAANGTVALGQRLLALGTLAVIVAWYALVSRQAMEYGDERWGWSTSPPSWSRSRSCSPSPRSAAH